MKKRVLNVTEKKAKKAKRTNKKSKKKSECYVDKDEENDCRSNEKWVQCLECKSCSHEKCTGGERQYVCHNCFSEEIKVLMLCSYLILFKFLNIMPI